MLLQYALGVATLLLVVPVALAAAHQANAVLVLTVALIVRCIPCGRPRRCAPAGSDGDHPMTQTATAWQ